MYCYFLFIVSTATIALTHVRNKYCFNFAKKIMKLNKQQVILITLSIIILNVILPLWKYYRVRNWELFEMDYVVFIFPSVSVVILFSIGLLYYVKDSNRNRLLKLLFQATFNYYLFLFICNMIVVKRIFSADYFDSTQMYIVYFVLNQFMSIVLVFLSYVVLKFLYKTEKPHIEIYQTGDVITRSLIAASQTKRFGNYFFDSLFYFFLIGRLAIEFQNFESNGLESIAIFMILFIYFFYHTLNEAIFQSTIGKVINKCTVTDANGDPIGWSEAVVRTLCRFIPFERFSIFFGRIPWHDQISTTEVLDLDEYQE